MDKIENGYIGSLSDANNSDLNSDECSDDESTISDNEIEKIFENLRLRGDSATTLSTLKLLTVDEPLTPDLDQRRPSTAGSFNFEELNENPIRSLNTKLLQAVENGVIEEINRQLELGANPNATCRLNGVTACHLAVLNDNDSLSLLIKAGAITFKTDACGRTPLHLAAWAGNSKLMSLLLDNAKGKQNELIEKTVTLEGRNKEYIHNLPDQWMDSMEHTCEWTNQTIPVLQTGWTALHVASSRAQYSCVQLLLEAGAKVNMQDDSERTPLDIVGESHSSEYKIEIQNFNKIINALCAANGRIYKSDVKDFKVGNTSLHIAVELESEEAIKQLLHAGATATNLNRCGLTPMHICVEKRSKELLKVLTTFKYFYNLKQTEAVNTKGINGLTVLHAAVKESWTVGVNIILSARAASVFVKAHDGNTPFHTAAAMGDLDILQVLLPFAKHRINTVNGKQQSALFLAIIHDHLEVVKLLLDNGAALKIHKPHSMNALHIIAKHGRVDILNYIVSYDSNFVERLKDDKCTSKHYTPLIYAVVNNHPDCVDVLLQIGAKVDTEVQYWNNFVYKKVVLTKALNIAAMKGYIEIAKRIIKFDKKSLNRATSVGTLPLHEACIHGHKEMITLLINKGADISAECPKLNTPIALIMHHVPNPTAYLEETMDSFIYSRGTVHDKEYKITVRYNMLWPNDIAQKTKVIKALINTGNRHGQRKLLQHPLIESFLYLQWKGLLPFFYPILALYGLFVLSLNIYIGSIFYYQDKNKLNITNGTNYTGDLYPVKHVPPFLHSDVWKYILYLTVILITVQELYIMKIKTKTYFLFLENWVKFGLIIISFSVPSLVSWRDPSRMEGSMNMSETTRLIATVALILTWLEMIFLLSRFPTWGIYALMCGKVAVKVLKVLSTFGILIMGFSLGFMIQFRASRPFEGPWASFTKTLIMMTSEYDYTSTMETAIKLEASMIILRVIFILFVVIASIVLMNLMVGVAVHDVTYLEKFGHQKRLEKQVDFLTSLQSVLSPKIIRKILPKSYCKTSFMDKKTKRYINLQPDHASCVYRKLLPGHIKEAIFEKAQLTTKGITVVASSANKQKLNAIHSVGVQENAKSEDLSKTNETIQDIKKEIENLRNDLFSIKQMLQNIDMLKNSGSKTNV